MAPHGLCSLCSTSLCSRSFPNELASFAMWAYACSIALFMHLSMFIYLLRVSCKVCLCIA